MYKKDEVNRIYDHIITCTHMEFIYTIIRISGEVSDEDLQGGYDKFVDRAAEVLREIITEGDAGNRKRGVQLDQDLQAMRLRLYPLTEYMKANHGYTYKMLYDRLSEEDFENLEMTYNAMSSD